MNAEAPTHGYVAICRKCGKATAATVDDTKHLGYVGGVVSAWIFNGLAVERMEIERARDLLFDMCECEAQP